MKVTVYNYREFDEKEHFDYFSKEYGLTLVTCPDAPNLENAELARGSDCVNIITSLVKADLVEKFASVGVKYIVTRTMGYDHIDGEACKKYDVHYGNAPYGPAGVADYTIMLMLMTLRNTKRIIERTNIQDYTLRGLQGKEMCNQTIGVIGTGRIGETVIRSLSGFGCKILAYDLYEKESVKKYAEYVSLETLYKEADVITLHTPLTADNHHLICKESLAKMRDGVILINTARGPLIDIKALIDALEEGKVGAAGLDVVEDEFALYYYDRKSDVLPNRDLAILRGYPNVTVTHHMAFYTDQYAKTVIGDSLKSCKLFMEGKDNPWQVS